MTTPDKNKTVAAANNKTRVTTVADQRTALHRPPVKVKKKVSKVGAKVVTRADKSPEKNSVVVVGDAPTKTAIKAKPAAKKKSGKSVNTKKPKLVRSSFSLPKIEREGLRDLKDRAQDLAGPVKKSVLLRAGIKALAAMSDAAFLAVLKGVVAVKAH